MKYCRTAFNARENFLSGATQVPFSKKSKNCLKKDQTRDQSRGNRVWDLGVQAQTECKRGRAYRLSMQASALIRHTELDLTTINKFSTDSGTVGDNITNDSTLTLTGTATANSTVNVYDGSALLGSATANASGAWSYTTGTLSNGAHSFTAATTSTGSPSSGFPDASTTGVPSGTALTAVNGNFTSSYAGQIIDARDVNGTIIVNHPGVIIRNCEATYITVNADNVTIEDTTVTGQNVGASGIDLLGSDNTTVRRCDISGVENGIWLEANGCVIADNYIHDLRNNASCDPHYDGLQIPGGSGVSNNLITHNNFDLGPGASSSITM